MTIKFPKVNNLSYSSFGGGTNCTFSNRNDQVLQNTNVFDYFKSTIPPIKQPWDEVPSFPDVFSEKPSPPSSGNI